MSDFNSQVELMQWLIDGNKAEYSGHKYFAKDGIFYCTINDMHDEKLSGLWTEFVNWNKFKKVTKWYEGINQDDKSTWKFCKVWDYGHEQYFTIDVIKNISPGYINKFEGVYATWKNALPLTENELKNPGLLYEDDNYE